MHLLAYLFFTIQLVSAAQAFKAGDGKVNDAFPFYTHKTITYDSLCAPGPNSQEPIFDGNACRNIYFGDLLRDLSQLNDAGLRKYFSELQVVEIVETLVKSEYKYDEPQFRVTPERLQLYRPEEHVDNPSYLLTTPTNQDMDPRFRGPLAPEEISISDTTSEKNYILPSLDASRQPAHMTIITHFRNTLTKAAQLMKQSTLGGGDAGSLKVDAYIAYGSFLHALGDFFAHTNYVELALHEIGKYNFDEVFPWVGRDASVKCNQDKSCYPLVSGHAVGGAELKIIALGMLKSKIRNLLGKISKRSVAVSHLEKRFWRKIKEAVSSAVDRVIQVTERVQETLVEPIRPAIDTAKKAAEKVAEVGRKITEPIKPIVSKVATTLARPLRPLLEKFMNYIDRKIEEAAAKSDGSKIFTDPKDTNPLHSQVGKDNNDNPLHAVAGQCAITAFRLISQPAGELLKGIESGKFTDGEISQKIDNILSITSRTLIHPAIGGTQESAQVLQNVAAWLNDQKNKNMIASKLIGFESCKAGKNQLY
ncbi:heterokaryon incompatibility protein Het-C-domain-containing protein [Paraphysoderma sedebokerense]|nr:heterokaryon incompatibility protein Het-C-domain-containing protein [Paraphysoderma sedebokerense]